MTCSLCILLGFSRDKVSLVATVFFFFSIFILSRQSFLCHDRYFFGSLTICPARFVVLSILCRDNLMCDYWNNYVATSTIMSRPCFCATSSNWCRDPVFMSRQHFCWFLLQQFFLYCQHSCRDQESLPQQSLVALNLISICTFILMLRHSLLVL